jgi:lysophospholipase L1-like esterase
MNFISNNSSRRLFILLPLVIFVGIYSSDSFSVSSQEQTKATKVLFIGNSYSFYNDLPGMLEKLAKANGKNIETKIVARNGASLQEHWNEKKALKTLNGENWDFIVLQERSSIVRDKTGLALKYAGLFDDAAKKINAQTLLYSTPAYKSEKNRLASYQAYLKLADKLKAEVVPVSPAFEKVFSKLPQIELHAPDGVHPNPTGTFLAAYLFYSKIFGNSPENINAKELKIDLSKEQEDIFRQSADCAL